MKKILLCLVFLSVAPLLTADPTIDQTKPLDLKFTAIDGRQVDLAKLRGKVVLIDFWATWCPPCRAISPDLVRLYDKYHAQGLEIIGVSVDSDKSALLDTVKKEGLVWPQYFDGNGVDNALSNRFGVFEFPTIFLIDKKGMIVTDKFASLWAVDGMMLRVTSEDTIKKIDGVLEKQLR